ARIGQQRRRIGPRRLVAQQLPRVDDKEFADALGQDRDGVFSAHRQDVLARDSRRDVASAKDRIEIALDVVGRALLHHQHRLLVAAELNQFLFDQGIGDVEHVERHGRLAVGVGETKILQRSNRAVVHAAEHDDADLAFRGAKYLVQLARLDEVDRRGHAALEFLLFVQERGWRQYDAIDVANRTLQRLAKRVRRLPVVLTDETPAHMAGPYADFQHDG